MWQAVVWGMAGLFLSASAWSTGQAKPATRFTQQAQQQLTEQLDLSDQTTFDAARRGFIAALEDTRIVSRSGSSVWDLAPYAFLAQEQAPDTVNPSLWRQARLNTIHGLFEVVPGMYQIRGMDLANMTVVEGPEGLIIIDPLFSNEAARAALELYYAHRPRQPIKAVIYSHSHIDHFAGVKGVVSEEQVSAGTVQIYAPRGFMAHAISENVIAGNAMSRRATYMYGTRLPVHPQGHVDNGLGKTLSAGEQSLIAPSHIIEGNELRLIAGVPIEFYLANGSEAPSEFMLYFPDHKVLNTAEVTSQHMHNVYTLRGAQVRDASSWSRYIDEVREQFAPRTEVLVAQHHWPVWGMQAVDQYLAQQRDLYKFIHDQSVRLLNHGLTPDEIAEQLKLPKSLEQQWSARGYYGTLKHNARGIYQKYLGWYDAHPASLDPLPAVAGAQKTLEYMGGADAVIKRARADYAEGQYRWVAQVMKQVVFAEPDNQAARELAADALEQLGYQAESGPWRNAYLSGALELRQGTPNAGDTVALSGDLLKALDSGMFFDLLGVRLNAHKAEGKALVLNWHFSDTNEHFRLNLQNSALTWLAERQAEDADASVSMTRATLDRILTKQTSFPKAVLLGDIKLKGNPLKFFELLRLMDEFEPSFAVIEPVRH